jgi:hypothetical protein
MFEGLFDFGKQRTLKQSVGFYLFYASLFLVVSGVASLLGY